MINIVNLDELYNQKINALVEKDNILRQSNGCTQNFKTLRIIKCANNNVHPQDAYIRSIQKIIENNSLNIKVEIVDVYSERHCVCELSYAQDKNYYILLMQPFPKEWKLDEITINNSVLTPYDLEGINSIHTSKFYNGTITDNIYPCTSKAVIDIIEFITGKTNGSGNTATIIGRSNIVGKPLIHMLLNRNYSVNICHSGTLKENIECNIGQSQIVITCIDKPEIFDNIDIFKNDSVIVDVGTCISERDGKLVGNISRNLYNVETDKNISITPVPKGVGRITPLILLENYYNLKFSHFYWR